MACPARRRRLPLAVVPCIRAVCVARALGRAQVLRRMALVPGDAGEVRAAGYRARARRRRTVASGATVRVDVTLGGDALVRVPPASARQRRSADADRRGAAVAVRRACVERAEREEAVDHRAPSVDPAVRALRVARALRAAEAGVDAGDRVEARSTRRRAGWRDRAMQIRDRGRACVDAGVACSRIASGVGRRVRGTPTAVVTRVMPRVATGIHGSRFPGCQAAADARERGEERGRTLRRPRARTHTTNVPRRAAARKDSVEVR